MFSKSLEEAARTLPNGEYAWRREVLPKVFAALSHKQCAVLGGEAWIIAGEDVVAAPQLKAGGTGAFQWSVEEPMPKEGWPAFVRRAAEDSALAVEDLCIESEAVIPAGGAVYFSLEWCSEDEY